MCQELPRQTPQMGSTVTPGDADCHSTRSSVGLPSSRAVCLLSSKSECPFPAALGFRGLPRLASLLIQDGAGTATSLILWWV